MFPEEIIEKFGVDPSAYSDSRYIVSGSTIEIEEERVGAEDGDLIILVKFESESHMVNMLNSLWAPNPNFRGAIRTWGKGDYICVYFAPLGQTIHNPIVVYEPADTTENVVEAGPEAEPGIELDAEPVPMNADIWQNMYGSEGHQDYTRIAYLRCGCLGVKDLGGKYRIRLAWNDCPDTQVIENRVRSRLKNTDISLSSFQKDAVRMSIIVEEAFVPFVLGVFSFASVEL
jgi:hypothetical protein